MPARYNAELANGFGNLASRRRRRWSAATSTARCPPTTGRRAGARRRAGAAAVADAEAAIDRDRPAGRDPGRDLELRRRRQRLPHRAGAVEGRQGRVDARADLRPDPLRHGRGAAGVAVLLNPVMPKACAQRCGRRSAPRPRSAPLGRPARRRTPVVGAAARRRDVTKAEPLFPRIEEPEPRRDARPREREPPPRARAAAGAGRRQPLPPRHRRPARRPAVGRRRAGARRPRSASRASCRSAATCRARAGRSRPPRQHDAVVAGVALHPNEAPRLAGGRRARRRAAPRSTRWRPSRDVRAVGETGLDHFRTGAGRPRRAGGVVPRAHRDGQAARQGAGDPRPRRPRRRAARARRRGRRRSAWSSTASPATPRWPGTASSRGW